MAKKRTQSYYRRNERYTMRDLGFEPTPGSGSGWIHKEDGQTDTTLAQLKSTDASSIRISLLDIQKLEQNSAVSNKRPVFVIQFLKDNSLYLLVRPDDDIMKVIHAGITIEPVELSDDNHEVLSIETVSSRTSRTGRDNFHKERDATHAAKAETYRKIRRSCGKEKPSRRLEPELPI